MESDIPSALLKKRIEDEGYEIAYNPIGDGMCFYDAVAYLFNVQRNGQFKGQVNAITVQDKVFEYLMKHRHDADGNDNLDIISSYDLGNEEVPTSWEEALDLLKKNYANYVVIKTLPDVLPYTLRIITDNGANRKDYNKVFEPKKEGSSVGTLHLGYYSEHYVALKPSLKKILNKKMASGNAPGTSPSPENELVKRVSALHIAPASDKPYEWIKDHPWADAQPSKGAPKIENIEPHTRYTVGSKWKYGNKYNLKKIVKDLPEFLNDMQQPVQPVNNGDESPHTPESPYTERNTYQARSLTCETNQKEYSVDVDGYMLKINIPTSYQKVLVDRNNKVGPQHKEDKDKRWIFIPSYLRASCALFDWTKTGVDDKNTTRIVVVRPNQYDNYIKYSGYLLPIISLPENTEGAGYARYWIQKIATAFDLPYIWMIDDSVKQFYEVHPDISTKKFIGRERNFDEVFKIMEDYAKKHELAAISPARFRGGQPGPEAFTYKPPVGAVYLNIKAINEKGITYRPQLKVLEDVVFAAECVRKGMLSVGRFKRIQFYDMDWKNSGSAVYSRKETDTNQHNTGSKTPGSKTPGSKTQTSKIQTSETPTSKTPTSETQTSETPTGKTWTKLKPKKLIID